jgi:hypothetical protein
LASISVQGHVLQGGCSPSAAVLGVGDEGPCREGLEGGVVPYY